MAAVADFFVSSGGLIQKQLFTQNAVWRVPIGVKQIRVSACAAGGAPEAGEFIVDKVFDVTRGEEISIIVGMGNTVIGNLQTLVAASISYNLVTNKLGYRTGFNGGTGYGGSGKGGYGGAFGFGGGGGSAGGYDNVKLGDYVSGGIDSDGPDGESFSGIGRTGGGGGGGTGGGSRPNQNGEDSPAKHLYNNGGISTNSTCNGGSGGIYGGGGGGGGSRNYYLSDISAGGGGGGYGAGGGIGGKNNNGGGAPGMVLIEW